MWRIEKSTREEGEGRTVGAGGQRTEYLAVGGGVRSCRETWERETEPRLYWPFDAEGMKGEKDEREHGELVRWILRPEGPFQGMI